MALSISPSGHFQGNDGPWSTFRVWIGDSSEPVELLPASSLSLTLVVLEEGCPQGAPAPNDCAGRRGNILDLQHSVTWSNLTIRDGSPYGNVPLPIEGNFLNESVGAEIGVDFLRLDLLGNVLTEDKLPLGGQLIAGYAAKSFFLGLLGLGGFQFYPVSGSDPYNSPLLTLENRSSISGPTWAYTAGASYKIPQSEGSLTFGGYDSSLINMDEALTGVNFPRGSGGNGDELTLTIKAIVLGDTEQPVAQVAVLDSTLPDIWLPQAICDVFAEKFNLHWNSTWQMYLVDSEQRAQLIKENISVSFDLTADSGSGKVVRITLPYLAFDREVKYPMMNITDDTTLYYLPLKPMPNQTTGFGALLGRTFFQEA
jgi:hypothetical protein